MKSHKLTNTPIHKTWMRMNKRCNNTNYEYYHRYGGRGIKVCERWKSFENFYSDMVDTHQPGLTLERIDNDGNYEPGNVKWATKKDQANNRSTSRKITINGITKTTTQWSEETGINRTTIEARLNRGVSPEKSIHQLEKIVYSNNPIHT